MTTYQGVMVYLILGELFAIRVMASGPVWGRGTSLFAATVSVAAGVLIWPMFLVNWKRRR